MLQTMLHLDEQLYRKLAGTNQSMAWATVAKVVSKSGDGYCYLLLALCLYGIDDNGGQFFSLMLLAFAFELPIYLLLKNTIRRARPFEVITTAKAAITPSDKFSLPSGHSAAATVMATSILIVYPPLFIPALLWAIAVALSRVILGVHYPTDLIVGACLGSLAVLIASTWI